MRTLTGLLAVAALAQGLAASAQTASPEAQAKLQTSATAYTLLDTYREVWTARSRTIPKDPHIPQGKSTGELRFARPNRLWLRWTEPTASGQKEHLVVCNGTTLWTWDSVTRKAARRQAPQDLLKAPGVAYSVPDAGALIRGGGLLESFMPPEAQFDVGPRAQVGHDVVDTLRADLSDANGKGQACVWLDVATHLFRGTLLTQHGKDPSSGRQLLFEAELKVTVSEVNPKLTDADFRFVAPRPARRAKR